MIVINRLFKKLLFTLFAGFISNSATAEWTFISTNKIGVKYYIDIDSIRESGSMVKMWLLSDYKNAESSERIKWYPDRGITEALSVKILTEVDCEHGQNRDHYIILYSESMGEGGKIALDYNRPSDWTPIVPGSVGQSLWKIACNKRGLGRYPPFAKAEWLKVHVIKSGDAFYFDPDTIYKDGQYREVWNLLDSRQKDNYGVYSSVMRIKYDCKNEKWRGLDMLSYSGSMGSGQILDSTLGGSEWMPVRRGTSFDTMLDIVCDKRG